MSDTRPTRPTLIGLNVRLPQLFADVVKCDRCSATRFPELLRDSGENVPQPGFVGRDYERTCVMFVGANPGVSRKSGPKARVDAEYTSALRAFRDSPNEVGYRHLDDTIRRVLPQWSVYRQYFPLAESRLELEQIAYCNLVRCRTVGNTDPSTDLFGECICRHFRAWLDLLDPRFVVFIGKKAQQYGESEIRRRHIPFDTINRSRRWSRAMRANNRTDVGNRVREALDGALCEC